jgi:arsenate reductase
MKSILILCTGNSCRSQIAHGFMVFFGDNNVSIYSAGIETHGLNPRAVEIMKEAGIDISGYSCNHVDEYSDLFFDHIITVCDHAKENCPYISSESAKRWHKNFSDPSKISSENDFEIHSAFTKTRDEIKVFCKNFIISNI